MSCHAKPLPHPREHTHSRLSRASSHLCLVPGLHRRRLIEFYIDTDHLPAETVEALRNLVAQVLGVGRQIAAKAAVTVPADVGRLTRENKWCSWMALQVSLLRVGGLGFGAWPRHHAAVPWAFPGLAGLRRACVPSCAAPRCLSLSSSLSRERGLGHTHLT